MSYEVLDINSFADKLDVSSSTVKTWKKTGLLVKGRHYYQRGRIVRFFWGELLIRRLMEDNVGFDSTTSLQEPAPLSIANAGTKPAGKDAVSPPDGASRCSAGKPTSTLPVEGGSNRGKDFKRKTHRAGKHTSTSPVEGGSNDFKRQTQRAGKPTSTSPVEGGSNRRKNAKPRTQINWDYC